MSGPAQLRQQRGSLFLAMTDQAAVSAGNFLLIALGAHYLPLHEQGVLVYAYAAYIGLVLFNASLFFAVAQVVKADLTDRQCYRRVLYGGQAASALATSICIAAAFSAFADLLGWAPSSRELFYLVLFLFLQQLVDFRRRVGYLFDHVRSSAGTSLGNFVLRVGLLLAVRPDDAGSFFAIMAAATLPGAFGFMRDQPWRVTEPCSGQRRRDIRAHHLAMSRWNLLKMPLTWCGWHLPVFLVGAFSSKEAAAILGSLRAITSFANILTELLETAAPAWLARRLASGGTEALAAAGRQLLYAGGVLWLAGFLILWTIGDTLAALLLGNAYATHASILLIIWAGNGIYLFARIIGLQQRMARDTFAELAGAIAGVATLALCLPLIATQGIWGGAWALALIQAGTVVGILHSSKRRKDHVE